MTQERRQRGAGEPQQEKHRVGISNQSRVSCNINRRGFLGVMGAVSGTALLAGTAPAHAVKKFEGWPDRYGMLSDLTACVGCRSCERACNEANGLPNPKKSFDDGSVFSELRRTDEKTYTVVNRYDNPRDPGTPIYRKVQCMHCNEPACATACPIHAYSKTPEGAVMYDPDKCFGCRYCMVACPFSIPTYDYTSALQPRIHKCVLCYDRLKAGRMPACAEGCPMEAITFGKRSDLLRLAHEKILEHPDRYIDHIYGEHEAGGTSWLYLSSVPFGELGFPTNLPDNALVEETKGFLSSVPVVFTVWPALFGMIYASVRHRDALQEELKQPREKEEERR